MNRYKPRQEKKKKGKGVTEETYIDEERDKERKNKWWKMRK